jgi:hypothetical protein
VIPRNASEFSILVVDPKNTNALDVLPSKRVVSFCDGYASTSSSSFFRVNGSGKDFNTVPTSLNIVSLVYDEGFPTTSSSLLTGETKEQLHSHHSLIFERIHDQLRKKNLTSLSIKQKLNELKTLLSPMKGRFPEYRDRSVVKPPFWQYCNTNHLVDIFERIFAV